MQRLGVITEIASTVRKLLISGEDTGNPAMLLYTGLKEIRVAGANSQTKLILSFQQLITPAVENIIDGNFHAATPNEKWLTDITEFQIPAGKAYLSPLVDTLQ